MSGLGIIYEDNHLLVVVKPAGTLAQGDATGRPNLLDQAKADLKVRHGRPGRVFLGLVHRLDRQAAGIMVLARTSKAATRLAEQFRDRRVQKVYWAVVHGRPEPPAGELTSRLIRRENKSIEARPQEPGGRPAHLSYRTLARGTKTALVEINLHTGRRHQIRAQLAALGHPLLGDGRYGSNVPPANDSIALFARALTLVHPTRGETMTFTADPSSDWPWLPLT
ncbi:MAG: RluA family pseudouridine synthase [Thermodesulfobacteriota bacterium]